MTELGTVNSRILDQAHDRIYARLPLSYESSHLPYAAYTAPVPSQVVVRLVTLKAGPASDLIRCDLEVAELQSRPFEALSYVWGDENDQHVIDCGGEPLSVRKNLFVALRNLRDPEVDRTLWIDAICINQKDLQERGRQVSLMGRIYGAARCVLVWLGEPHNDDFEAFGTIIALADLMPKREPTFFSRSRSSRVSRAEIDSYGVVNHLRFHHLLIFFSRPWFERVWVIQEVVRARRATVLCGTRHMPWDEFAKVVLSFNDALGYLMSQYHGESVDKVTALDNLPAMNSLKKYNEKMTLFSILCVASTFKSTDERDKLFALLNLGNRSSLRIQPDYTTDYFNVFKRHIVYELTERRRLDYLARPPVRRQDWPSWVPDWTEKSRSSYFYTAIDHEFRAALDSSPTLTVSDDILTIKGKVVDRIANLVAPMDRSRPRQSDDSEETIDPEEIVQWLEECMSLVPLKLGLVRDAADSALNPLLRTFACNGVHGGHQLGRLLHWPRDHTTDLRRDLEKLSDVYESINDLSNTQQSLLDPVTELASKLYPAITDRQFFQTRGRKRLGWVSKRAKKDDAVCVLYGGAVPFVLREQHNGRWRIVGECYVDGYMEGQAMEMTNLPDRFFRIC